MKMPLFLMILALIISSDPAIGQNQNAMQAQGTASPVEKDVAHLPNGTFFLTPFYQFTHFDKLHLVSLVNTHTLWVGNSTDRFEADDIQDYNDVYGTSYSNSMTGIRAGYQILNGLGVNAYAGINHFTFRSWDANDNTQTASTDYPSITLGIAVDYEKSLGSKLAAIAFLSYNYCLTKSMLVINNSGEDVIGSKLRSMYWEANLAIGYTGHKIVPFGGVGISQQFVHSQTTEQILTETDEGVPQYNQTQSDARFNGIGLYGFAGLEYRVRGKYAFFIRGSFPNPLRATTGVRIKL